MPEPARSPVDPPLRVEVPPESGNAPAVTTPDGAAPLVAPAARRKDRALPILIVGSLLVHALIFLPSLWHRPDDAPREIAVDLVQDVPKPPAPPSAASHSTPPSPPPAPEPPEPPKPQPTKSQPTKPQPDKPDPPKPQPKPQPSKPEPKPADRSKPTDPSRENVAQRMKDLLGAMPAIALPGEDATGTDAVSYEQLVLSKVSKAKKEGRHEGIPGAATVTFHLDDAGGVASVRIVHASGDPSLDGEAVAMIRRGAPYPPPPPDAQRDFTITLRFMQLP